MATTTETQQQRNAKRLAWTRMAPGHYLCDLATGDRWEVKRGTLGWFIQLNGETVVGSAGFAGGVVAAKAQAYFLAVQRAAHGCRCGHMRGAHTSNGCIPLACECAGFVARMGDR